MRSALATVLSVLTFFPAALAGQDGCATLDRTFGDPDLRCLDLVPAPAAVGLASGHVELRHVPGPFTVAVTPAGEHIWRLHVVLDSLPDPSVFGAEYDTYVAWATTPVLRPMKRLGPVSVGANDVGRVGLDKFLVWISAEASDTVPDRRGPLVLRGTSPSMRLQPDHMPVLLSEAARGRRARAETEQGRGDELRQDPHIRSRDAAWPHPAMPKDVVMLPGMMPRPPLVSPFVPEPVRDEGPMGTALDAGAATPRTAAPERRLANDRTTELTAAPVTRSIGGRSFTGWSYDGTSPGPLLRVRQGDTIRVRFRNRTELPLTVHWHGLRLDNRFDGVPGLTQAPVLPGAAFEYELRFPDAGVFWYHPHHREDIAQDLGLYGNIIVDPVQGDAPNPVHREVPLFLDDLLLAEDGSVLPHGLQRATHALMGRFGNVLLLNGRTDWSMQVGRGTVIRFPLTNAANTRTFNVSFGIDSVKLVASDVGNYVRESRVSSVPIAPAERYVVEVKYEEPGRYAITNRVHAIDHVLGAFVPRVDTLGMVAVTEEPATSTGARAEYEALRSYAAVAQDIARYRDHFARPPDRTLTLRMEADSLPFPFDRLMRLDSAYFHPVEWAGTMPMMNWIVSTREVEWVLEDAATGARNQAIDWDFDVGDVVKIRIVNERGSLHAMQHPIHLHGQRFLVLTQDGVPNEDLVWKDTILMPVGSWADILVDFSNPGKWMLHCHIAEHLEAGMKMTIDVGPPVPGPAF